MITVYKYHDMSMKCYREVTDASCRETIPGDTQKLSGHGPG